MNVGNFYETGGVVLAYSKVDYMTGSIYVKYIDEGSLKLLHAIYAVSKNFESFRLWIEMDARGTLKIARTSNGFKPDNIAMDDIPDSIKFRLVVIKASSLNSGKSDEKSVPQNLKANGADVDNYEAVMDNYGLAY